MSRVAQEQSAKNLSRVTIGSLTLWFSYGTCIAFEHDGKRVLSENLWGAATGMHLAMISRDKNNRHERPTFEAALEAVLKHSLATSEAMSDIVATSPKGTDKPPVKHSAEAIRIAELVTKTKYRLPGSRGRKMVPIKTPLGRLTVYEVADRIANELQNKPQSK